MSRALRLRVLVWFATAAASCSLRAITIWSYVACMSCRGCACSSVCNWRCALNCSRCSVYIACNSLCYFMMHTLCCKICDMLPSKRHLLQRSFLLKPYLASMMSCTCWVVPLKCLQTRVEGYFTDESAYSWREGNAQCCSLLNVGVSYKHTYCKNPWFGIYTSRPFRWYFVCLNQTTIWESCISVLRVAIW